MMPLRRQRELRRLVKNTFRAIELRPPLDVEDLCERLGRLRGRPIVLAASIDLPLSKAFALWLETRDADHIIYQQHTSFLHQQHHILHEIGHMLAGHDADRQDRTRDAAVDEPDDMLLSLVPHLSPELVRLSLKRHAYDTVEEQEAEFIAGTILQWAADLEIRPVQPVARRLQDVFDDGRGWL